MYRCRGCDGQLHDGDEADRFVTMYLTSWLSRPQAAGLLPRHSPVPQGSREALEREETSIITKMETQAALHAADAITDTQLMAGTKVLKERLAAVRAELREANQHSPLSQIAGRQDAAEVFAELSLGYQHAIIRLLVDIVFMPGSVAEDGSVEIRWKHLQR